MLQQRSLEKYDNLKCNTEQQVKQTERNYTNDFKNQLFMPKPLKPDVPYPNNQSKLSINNKTQTKHQRTITNRKSIH